MTPDHATTDPVADLSQAIAEAAASLREDRALEPVKLERPPKPELGDYSTNAAMALAPVLGKAPREIAEQLGAALQQTLGDAIDRVEVAGPGFLNVFVADRWYAEGIAGIVAAGDGFGAGDPDLGERINIEFVSANPTGPITVASGRHAAYGDALARVLELAGNDVDREFYVNDHGGQIERFAASIRARGSSEDPPPDGYQGAYVADVAAEIGDMTGLDDDQVARKGIEIMLTGVRGTLERFGVHMDRFSSERSNYEQGVVAHALELLDANGHTFEQEGARWLRSSAFGDDKDRVLTRSNGELTYFAADIGYHQDKRERSDRVLDVLGADHHGYIGRMRAAWEALGGDPSRYEVVIMQLVNLIEAGERARMSKREGAIVALDDLIDDIGVDATRWFLLQRSHDTALDIDLDLARTKSQDNPAFYVQYAHARIASILRKAGHDRVAAALAADLPASAERPHPSAKALVKKLLEFPTEVQTAAARRAPHRMTTYVTEVSQAFSGFYRDCKVVGAADEGGDEDLRIALSEVTRRVIERGLGVLGVSAPAEM